jgi:hypothetical protein
MLRIPPLLDDHVQTFFRERKVVRVLVSDCSQDIQV